MRGVGGACVTGVTVVHLCVDVWPSPLAGCPRGRGHPGHVQPGAAGTELGGH